MPIESSKGHIGGSLGLDFGSYLQGKSFTRSVSISEATPTASATDCTVRSGASNSPQPSFPNVARFASGGNGVTEISPSPLSSATATVSPDSPLPSSLAFSAPFPLESDQLTAPRDQVVSDTQAMHTNVATHSSTTGAIGVPEANCPIVRQPTRSQHMRSVIPGLSKLLQNPLSHRTINLLSHLLDSRLSPEWREALVSNWTTATRPASLNVLQPSFHNSDIKGSEFSSHASSTLDQTDSTAVRRPSPPTPSPSETVVVKRVKPNEHESSKESTDPPSSDIPPSGTMPDYPDSAKSDYTSVPSTFISPTLAQCVGRLTNHFEARYRDKLGDLLEDVARLSVSSRSTDETASSVPDNEETKTTDELNQVAERERNVVSTELPAIESTDCVEDQVRQELYSIRARFHTVLSELFAERVNWGRVVAMLAFLRALCVFVEGRQKIHSNAVSELNNNSNIQTPEAIPNAPPSEQDGHSSDAPPDGTNSSNSVAELVVHPVSVNVDSKNIDKLSVSDSLDEQMDEGCIVRAAHYVTWAAEFIHGPQGIWHWISTHGGWEGLILFEKDRGIAGPQQGQHMIIGMTEDEAMRMLRGALLSATTLVVGAVGLVGAVGIVAALRYLKKRL